MNDDTQASAAADQRRRRNRRLWIGILVLVFALGLIGYGGYWFLLGRYRVSTDDAYVGGNSLTLTPQIVGTVVAIAADDTDRVKAGEPVITLDRSNVDVALARAEADLGQAVRHVRELRAEADATRADLSLRRAELAQAQRDYERDRHLLKVQGVTLAEFQHAETAYHGARQRVRSTQAHLDALEAQIDGVSLRDTPQVQQAVAALHQAWLDVQRTRIIAPADGYVAQRSAQIGERVAKGQALLSIVPLSQVWVDANFKETQLSRVRIGQPVRLTADLYGGDVVYHGHVAGIAAGTGSAFELLPPENATGNWIKIVRRVPVRITLDTDEVRKHPLRLGLSMAVRVDTHDLGGPELATAPPAKAVYATDVYNRQGRGFDALVTKILGENGARTDADTGAGAAS